MKFEIELEKNLAEEIKEKIEFDETSASKLFGDLYKKYISYDLTIDGGDLADFKDFGLKVMDYMGEMIKDLEARPQSDRAMIEVFKELRITAVAEMHVLNRLYKTYRKNC